MARTALTVQTPVGPYPVLPLGALAAQLTFANSDNANGNSFPCTGRELIVLNNTTGGALTITIGSVVDERNRSGDISAYSIPAAGFAMLGPFPTAGWMQAGGVINVDTSGVLKIAIIRLPSTP